MKERDIQPRTSWRRAAVQEPGPHQCLWCGRNLRKHGAAMLTRCCGVEPMVPHASYQDLQDAAARLNSNGRLSRLHERCSRCGADAPRDNLVPNDSRTFGDYGDGAFCGLRCGYAFGVAATKSGARLRRST